MRKAEWFADETFWKVFYPYLFSQARYAAAQETVNKLLKMARPKHKAALDLCCGPGRCSIALAKKGYTVTGVDLSSFLLDKAKSNAKKQKVTIEWIKSDMRDFIRPDSFGLIINTFSSFGYFHEKKDDIRVLRNIYDNLKSEGLFVLEMKSKEWLCKYFKPTTSDSYADGTVLVQRHRLFDNCTRIENEWIIIQNGRSKSYKFHHTIYTAQEMIDRLAHVGFKSIKIAGDLKGSKYDVDSNMMIVIAKK
jgi:SAM-dependent methyltransferase